MNQPLVSLITVNFNQPEVTLELVASLDKQDYQHIEIIVVDNGSKRPFTSSMTQNTKVKVIRSDKNLGFAGGNNLGIAEAKGDFLFFVNNDTEIPQNTIQSLVERLKNDSSLGAVSPLIHYFDQPHLTQFAGYTPMNLITGRNSAIGYKQQIVVENKITPSSFLHGAAMMVRKSVIGLVGLMSDNYFLYYEELDWCQRMKDQGYQLAVDYRSSILHKESISTGKDSTLMAYFKTRNRILYMRKNAPTIFWLIFCAFFLFFSLPKTLINYLRHQQYEHIKNVVAGIWWNIQEPVSSARLGYKYDSLLG
ncbi:MAG: glycosyltransferase family 2 protein [Cyclobacteriaceae bacterium]